MVIVLFILILKGVYTYLPNFLQVNLINPGFSRLLIFR